VRTFWNKIIVVIFYFIITTNSYTKLLKLPEYIYPSLKIKENGVIPGLLHMPLFHWKRKTFILYILYITLRSLSVLFNFYVKW